MNISINCPSYKRPIVETLDYLPFCKVWVDGSEYEEYKKKNIGANIIMCDDGIQGNVCRVRNYILKTEFDNEYDVVLIIDDDMKGVYYFEGKDEFAYEKHLVERDMFFEFVEKFSVICMDIGAKLWGININSDSQSYRQYSPFSTVSYIGAPFQCFMKGNRCWYDEELPLKEDYDMTLQQLNTERVVLRVNKYHYSVKQSKQAGGCSTYRNYQREEEQIGLLVKKWGSNIVKIDESDKSHTRKKMKTKIDYNPIIRPPIRGI